MGDRANVVGYDEIIKIISGAPLTYLPAILLITVETCLSRNVFIDGATLVDIVKKVVYKQGP